MGDSATVESLRAQRFPDAPPLNRIADHCAVFLDFDGTLLNLARRPDQVEVDSGLLYLLDDLYVATAGATAVFSGRSIENLDALLAPLRLPVAGVHGAQRRRADGSVERCAIPASTIWQLRVSLLMRMRRYAGLYVEDRGCSFAVHYQGSARPALRQVRSDLEGFADGSRGIFEVVDGADVFELRPRSYDKGRALQRFMSEAPFEGRFPIYVGDDETDRSGFAAVNRLNGMSIAVGTRVAAPWSLPDPCAVREWLRDCMGLGH